MDKGRFLLKMNARNNDRAVYLRYSRTAKRKPGVLQSDVVASLSTTSNIQFHTIDNGSELNRLFHHEIFLTNHTTKNDGKPVALNAHISDKIFPTKRSPCDGYLLMYPSDDCNGIFLLA